MIITRVKRAVNYGEESIQWVSGMLVMFYFLTWKIIT